MPKKAIWGAVPPCQARLLQPTAATISEALLKAAVLNPPPSGESLHHDSGQAEDAERRRDRRVVIRMPVVFRADGHWEAGRTRDVSLGGMYVETASPRRLGTRVVVEFHAGGLKEPLTTRAVVRWVERGNGMGLQFDSPRPLVVWALQRELAAR